MESSVSEVNWRRLIKGPALIALAVTVIRLLGELMGGPPMLFSREAGGGGAIVGIAWLIPIFGVYFAVKLIRGGQVPSSAGRVAGFAVLGLVVGAVLIVPVFLLTGDPNQSVSAGAAWVQQLGIAVASVVVLLIVRKGWPAFFQTMLGYAFASRVPVIAVMLLAILGDWGTHYELGPPGYPEMGFFVKFILVAVLPQLSFWVMITVTVAVCAVAWQRC